jgi:iron complex outermembrane receptor protein
MSGERLLVLEDGVSTGDLSSTSPDHAVLIDPASAHQVEVVRGPAALAFGSSVVGGVINVDRGYVPRTRLDRLHGRVQVQGETASRSRATHVEMGIPWDDYVAQIALSGRQGENVHTPAGEIGNTSIQTWKDPSA